MNVRARRSLIGGARYTSAVFSPVLTKTSTGNYQLALGECALFFQSFDLQFQTGVVLRKMSASA